MKLGLIQGRLSEPKEGFQDTPKEWKREFTILDEINLNHIEWIITKKSCRTNPFFTDDLSGFSINSVCADNLVDSRIGERDYASPILNRICEAAIKNNVKNITIPLLEDSSIEDDKKRNNFAKILKDFCQRYPNLNFSLEAELSCDKLKDLLSVSNNVFVTYDTGNMTSCGFDHKNYIREISSRISNVHLKDRLKTGVTVVPLTGDTNFSLIFKTLKENSYTGVYTLQTARQETGFEKQTITNHAKILRSIYDKSI
jgi:L-ribulose-5-phosphate 3-epimerase|tara:strand:- start:1547 stop:2314 length:768 start_codon:yes stop_codon:yes gene_type:complete